MSTILFPLGQCVITPAALEALQSIQVAPRTLIERHQAGDWAEMDEHDQAENREAVTSGFRILSAYTLANNLRVWVITEADRSVTTILLPSDY